MTGYALSSAFSIGDPVEISGIGPGIINEILGGPETWLYRVVLFGLDIDTGLPTSRVVRDVDMVPGDPLPPFEVGQHVHYIGRIGVVTVVYGDRVTFVIPGDPVDEYSGVSEPRRFDMETWKLHLHQQVG